MNPIKSLISWLEAVLKFKKNQEKRQPYRRIKLWEGTEGNLHLIERDAENSVATFVWLPRRDRRFIPNDLWFDLQRSRLVYTIVIVECPHLSIEMDTPHAMLVYEGQIKPTMTARNTKRRMALVAKFSLINQFEARDRTAVLILFGVAQRRLFQSEVDWANAIAQEVALVVGQGGSGEPQNQKGNGGEPQKNAVPLSQDSVRGVILDD